MPDNRCDANLSRGKCGVYTTKISRNGRPLCDKHIGYLEGATMPDDNVPHIQAACAYCGYLFDLKFGTDCPCCLRTGVSWARLVPDAEAEAKTRIIARLREWANEKPLQQPWAKKRPLKHCGDPCSECNNIIANDGYCSNPVCRYSRNAGRVPERSDVQYQHYATEHNWTLTDGEKLDVAELYRTLALEDPRTDQG